MKSSAHLIARAFVEICSGLPEAKVPEACDAVLELMTRQGLGHSIRTFPRMVRGEFLRQGNTAPVTMTFSTLEGDRHFGREELSTVLERTLRKTVEVEERGDPSLIGGVLVQAGDERFDASIRGALQQFSSALS